MSTTEFNSITSEASNTGRTMPFKWPDQLITVDIPAETPACRQGNPDNLPEVISTEIITSCDPRLLPGLPEASIYFRAFNDHYIFEGEDDEDSNEDWYMKDLEKACSEEAGKFKLVMRMNPKFFNCLTSISTEKIGDESCKGGQIQLVLEEDIASEVCNICPIPSSLESFNITSTPHAQQNENSSQNEQTRNMLESGPNLVQESESQVKKSVLKRFESTESNESTCSSTSKAQFISKKRSHSGEVEIEKENVKRSIINENCEYIGPAVPLLNYSERRDKIGRAEGSDVHPVIDRPIVLSKRMRIIDRRREAERSMDTFENYANSDPKEQNSDPKEQLGENHGIIPILNLKIEKIFPSTELTSPPGDDITHGLDRIVYGQSTVAEMNSVDTESIVSETTDSNNVGASAHRRGEITGEKKKSSCRTDEKGSKTGKLTAEEERKMKLKAEIAFLAERVAERERAKKARLEMERLEAENERQSMMWHPRLYEIVPETSFISPEFIPVNIKVEKVDQQVYEMPLGNTDILSVINYTDNNNELPMASDEIVDVKQTFEVINQNYIPDNLQSESGALTVPCRETRNSCVEQEFLAKRNVAKEMSYSGSYDHVQEQAERKHDSTSSRHRQKSSRSRKSRQNENYIADCDLDLEEVLRFQTDTVWLREEDAGTSEPVAKKSRKETVVDIPPNIQQNFAKTNMPSSSVLDNSKRATSTVNKPPSVPSDSMNDKGFDDPKDTCMSSAKTLNRLSDFVQFSPNSIPTSYSSRNMEDKSSKGFVDKGSFEHHPQVAVGPGPEVYKTTSRVLHEESVSCHLPCLSLMTQFESQFTESMSVRSIHLEAMKDWMVQKPLEMFMCGRLKDTRTEPQPFLLHDPSDCVVTNSQINFSSELQDIVDEALNGKKKQEKRVKNVLGMSAPAVDIADSLFSEVRQHLEFLTTKTSMQEAIYTEAKVCEVSVGPIAELEPETPQLFSARDIDNVLSERSDEDRSSPKSGNRMCSIIPTTREPESKDKVVSKKGIEKNSHKSSLKTVDKDKIHGDKASDSVECSLISGARKNSTEADKIDKMSRSASGEGIRISVDERKIVKEDESSREIKSSSKTESDISVNNVIKDIVKTVRENTDRVSRDRDNTSRTRSKDKDERNREKTSTRSAKDEVRKDSSVDKVKKSNSDSNSRLSSDKDAHKSSNKSKQENKIEQTREKSSITRRKLDEKSVTEKKDDKKIEKKKREIESVVCKKRNDDSKNRHGDIDRRSKETKDGKKKDKSSSEKSNRKKTKRDSSKDTKKDEKIKVKKDHIISKSGKDVDKKGKNEDKSTKDENKSTKDVDKSKKDVDDRVKHIDKGTKDVDKSIKDDDKSTRDVDKSKKDIDERVRHVDKGTKDIDKGTKDVNKSLKDDDKGTRDVDKSKKDIDERVRHVDQSTKDDKSTKDVDKGTRDIDERVRHVDQSTKDVDKSTKDVDKGIQDDDKGTRDVDKSKKDVDERVRHVDQSTKDVDKSTKDVDKGIQDDDKGTRDVDKSKKDVDERVRHDDQSTKDVDKIMKDEDKGTKGVDKSTKDISKSSRDVDKSKKDVDKGTKDVDKSTKIINNESKEKNQKHKNRVKSSNDKLGEVGKKEDSKVNLSHLLQDVSYSASQCLSEEEVSDVIDDELMTQDVIQPNGTLNLEDCHLESLPMMQCCMDQNTNYLVAVKEFQNTFPEVNKFRTNLLSRQNSFVWALALAVLEKNEDKKVLPEKKDCRVSLNKCEQIATNCCDIFTNNLRSLLRDCYKFDIDLTTDENQGGNFFPDIFMHLHSLSTTVDDIYAAKIVENEIHPYAVAAMVDSCQTSESSVVEFNKRKHKLDSKRSHSEEVPKKQFRHHDRMSSHLNPVDKLKQMNEAPQTAPESVSNTTTEITESFDELVLQNESKTLSNMEATPAGSIETAVVTTEVTTTTEVTATTEVTTPTVSILNGTSKIKTPLPPLPKSPKFLQVYRKNLLAKRKHQQEHKQTATGGKLIPPKPTVIPPVKHKPIGLTLEETLAVLSTHATTSSTITSSTTILKSPTVPSSGEFFPPAIVTSPVISSGTTVPHYNQHNQPPHIIQTVMTPRVQQDPCPIAPPPAVFDKVSHVNLIGYPNQVPYTHFFEGNTFALNPSDVYSNYEQSAISTEHSSNEEASTTIYPPMQSPSVDTHQPNWRCPSDAQPNFTLPEQPAMSVPCETSDQLFQFPQNQMPIGRPHVPLQQWTLNQPVPLMSCQLMPTRKPALLVRQGPPARSLFGEPHSFQTGPKQSLLPTPPGGPQPQLESPHCRPPIIPRSLPRDFLPAPPKLRKRCSSSDCSTPGQLEHHEIEPPQQEFQWSYNSRVYVFNQDKAICKSIERFLGFKGAVTFDPWNIVSLRFVGNIECLVFVHRGDCDIIHNIPNLLQLKRDLRVNFVVYNDVMNVKYRSFDYVFPKGGVVVMEDGVLLSLKPEVIRDMCEYMLVQSKERSKPWLLVLSASIFDHLEFLKNTHSPDSTEFQQLSEIVQILMNYKFSGIVELLHFDNFTCNSPKSVSDYLACCSSLQIKYMSTYRHFLFVTDLPKTHRDAQMFVNYGIDVLTIADFMRGFISKFIEYRPHLDKFCSIREPTAVYADLILSSAVERCIKG